MRTLGESHPQTLKSASYLGSLRISTGEYTKAETLLIRVLALREKMLGSEHVDTLRSAAD